MASASSTAAKADKSASGGFDFVSDNIFCSYEDYDNQDANNGVHTDSNSTDSNSTKQFNQSRVARPSAYPSAAYAPPMGESSDNQVVISTVENTMKKCIDNLLRFLEGISSRLSQLELSCYNLDKSIGEMRFDLVRDHGESETKLKSLEKHVEEIHRSVQILRDKQELADTQKELAKLHRACKESSNSQQSDDRAATPNSEVKESKNSSDSHDQQVALTLPHQVPPQSSRHSQLDRQQPHPGLPHSMPSQAPLPSYYLTSHQVTNAIPVAQPSQNQYLPPQSDHSRMPTSPRHYHMNPNSQVQLMSGYPQQWSQQPQPPVQQPQQPVMQPKIRSPSQVVCSGYIPNHTNQSPTEMVSNTISVQVPGFTSPDGASYSYSTAGRPIQPQQVKVAYCAAQPGNTYPPSGPRPAIHPGNTYLMYDGESGRAHHPPPQVHYQQNPYPSSTISPQKPQQFPPGASMMVPHLVRSHPYNELIEKLGGMGYRSEHVVGVIQRLEENGQAIDFNTVLDRLNKHSDEGHQRGWPG